jgi:uncharacterized HhH-GPD family protein
MPIADIPVTGDPDADRFLAENPLALLLGMLLDQQVPMEWAFKGPWTLQQRLGGLDARAIADLEPDQLDAAFRTRPAVHRFPSAMAKRTQALCRILVDEYGGDAAALWRDVPDGAELLARLEALPGFGAEKSKIFVAVLAKRLGVRPPGWEQAAAPFSDDTPRSVADIDSPETLTKVRQYKQQLKAKAKAKANKPG